MRTAALLVAVLLGVGGWAHAQLPVPPAPPTDPGRGESRQTERLRNDPHQKLGEPPLEEQKGRPEDPTLTALRQRYLALTREYVDSLDEEQLRLGVTDLEKAVQARLKELAVREKTAAAELAKVRASLEAVMKEYPQTGAAEEARQALTILNRARPHPDPAPRPMIRDE